MFRQWARANIHVERFTQASVCQHVCKGPTFSCPHLEAAWPYI